MRVEHLWDFVKVAPGGWWPAMGVGLQPPGGTVSGGLHGSPGGEHARPQPRAAPEEEAGWATWMRACLASEDCLTARFLLSAWFCFTKTKRPPALTPVPADAPTWRRRALCPAGAQICRKCSGDEALGVELGPGLSSSFWRPSGRSSRVPSPATGSPPAPPPPSQATRLPGHSTGSTRPHTDLQRPLGSPPGSGPFGRQQVPRRPGGDLLDTTQPRQPSGDSGSGLLCMQHSAMHKSMISRNGSSF